MAVPTPTNVWSGLSVTQAVALGIPYIDPDSLQPNVDPAGLSYIPSTQETNIKKLAVEQAIAGASGNIILNAMAGQVQLAAGAQSLVLTNDRIEADSIIICTVATDDATAFAAKGIVTGVGVVTIKTNAVTTGITKINFLVLRAK
jgi:hypothetical protein